MPLKCFSIVNLYYSAKKRKGKCETSRVKHLRLRHYSCIHKFTYFSIFLFYVLKTVVFKQITNNCIQLFHKKNANARMG